MTDQKPTRREILRPLHLLGIALACGVFAMLVTIFSTGGFTSRVRRAIANGTYHDLPPVTLGLVIGGISFIVTLLLLAMLMLAVNPSDVTKTIDKPVLLEPKQKRSRGSADAASADAAGGEPEQPDATQS
ncbi:hypothetical protein Q9R19_09620 [Microbacterium sp. ARD32]|uniref:hypothetical protein n=1 Tax=Microbacterium sp. ARD32 TaxID=2962577 RepID=UPI0028820CF7|nr:hypothetical protein [Microbacterium sp. ARD32]MDT0157880.1 hypothetical protein [Microbacterium sp. ARD32]